MLVRVGATTEVFHFITDAGGTIKAWRVLDESATAAAALPHMRSVPAILVMSVRYRPQCNGIRVGVALRRLLLQALRDGAVQATVHLIKPPKGREVGHKVGVYPSPLGRRRVEAAFDERLELGADDAKPDIAGRAAWRVRAARRHTIAVAIGIVAKERAAAQRAVRRRCIVQGIFCRR
jgi:hypothetical protein